MTGNTIGQQGREGLGLEILGRPTRKLLRSVLERGILWASRILTSMTYILEKAVKKLIVKSIKLKYSETSWIYLEVRVIAKK